MMRISVLLTIVTLLHTPAYLQAQDPFDPFGGGAAPLAPPAGAAADPAPAEAPESDPVVLSFRAENPRTPAGLMRAVEVLLNLGRQDEAQKYLQTLVNANLDQQTLAQVHGQFGSTLFLRLIQASGLQPAGAQFGKAVLDAAYQDARSPRRLQSLIRQLSDPDETARYAATVDLQSGGESAVAALISVLADRARASEHPRIRHALERLGRLSTTPLIAALAAEDDALRLQVAVTLGRLDAAAATPYLLGPFLSPQSSQPLHDGARLALLRIVGPLPTLAEAQRYLARRVREHLAVDPDQLDPVTSWRWDPGQRAVVPEQISARVASLRTAFRLASELRALAPEDSEHGQLYLLALLQSAKSGMGPDEPLRSGDPVAYAAAVQEGVSAVEQVLSTAMRQGHASAAIAAAELLGDLGDEQLLQGTGGRSRPLASALQHPNRRLRFAAAMSILKIDPQAPFAGSSHLPETLGYFLNTLGTPRALIVHPRLDQSQTLAGLLSEMGFEADIASTGAEALRQSVRSSDYEFILVSDAVDRPPVNELIQQLRRQPQTADLPIGLMARQANFHRMERLTEFDALAEAFPRPHNRVGLTLAVRRLLQRGQTRRVGFEQRVRQAQNALEQMARLAEEPRRYDFYDLFRQEPALERTLQQSLFSTQAARVLGLLGTPSAQRALITVASHNARSLADRQAAAGAFAVAVRNRGLLLSRPEILVQYDRYNESATLDQETQQVLGSLLDAIEAPSRAMADAASRGAASAEQ